MSKKTYLQRLQDGARAFVTGPGAVPDSSSVDSAYLALLGGDTNAPDYGEYIKTSNAVYVAARLRSQLLSSLPIVAYRVDAQGKRERVTAGPLVELLSKVNPYWTFARLVEMTELSLCLWGSAFIFMDRGTNRRQIPRELWWAKPDRVTVVPDRENYLSHFLYQTGPDSEPLRFERDEVIWLRYPNPLDEFAGLSPLASAAIAADTSRAAMLANAGIFRNGLQLAGVVTPKNGVSFSEEQAVALERAMSRRFKGSDKAHRWGVLRFDAQFQPLSVTPKDAEFLGSLKWSLEEICRAYGVPLDLVGGERTYANQRDARLAIWTDTVLPEARFISGELTEQLLPIFGRNVADVVEFDSSGVAVLQEAEAAKWQIEKEKIDNGVLLPNEWRFSKGLDPVPWGDAWWAPTGSGGLGPVSATLPPVNASTALSNGTLTANELRRSQGLEPVPWGDVWWPTQGTVPVAAGEIPDGSPPDTSITPPEPPTTIDVPERSARAVADIDLTPPETVAEVARRALRWKADGADGGTAVGLARANQLAARERLSPETIGRMVSYFARHEVDKQAEGFNNGEDGFPSPGRVAWDLWGGDPGRAWAERKYAQIAAESERGFRTDRTKIAYGSPEHVARWEAYVRAADNGERELGEAVAELMRRQRQAVLARLKSGDRGARSLEGAAQNPFDMARWVREFRVVIRPILGEIIGRAGQDAINGTGVGLSFDVLDPNALNFLERQTQRFAVQVNDTTWKQLQGELAEAIRLGEGVPKAASRVETVMGNRIRSSGEAIARTEVGAAINGGQIEGWQQSGVVIGKRWLSALDARTRETHVTVHDKAIPLDHDFRVGSAVGPGPSQMSTARETVNCRCTLTPVLDTETVDFDTDADGTVNPPAPELVPDTATPSPSTSTPLPPGKPPKYPYPTPDQDLSPEMLAARRDIENGGDPGAHADTVRREALRRAGISNADEKGVVLKDALNRVEDASKRMEKAKKKCKMGPLDPIDSCPDYAAAVEDRNKAHAEARAIIDNNLVPNTIMRDTIRDLDPSFGQSQRRLNLVGTKELQGVIQNQSEWFPEKVWDSIADKSDVYEFNVVSVDRGYYQPYGRRIGLSPKKVGSNSRELLQRENTARHELWHVAEDAMPYDSISGREAEFLRARVAASGDTAPTSLGYGGETAWRDDFLQHYTGKTYADINDDREKFYEVGTTGVQSIFSYAGSVLPYADADHANFVVRTILELGS